jgi:hypothetical protein
MPMIDAYADSALFPKESPKAPGLDLTNAVLLAEGVTHPGAFHLRNIAAFLNLRERNDDDGLGDFRREQNRNRRGWS